MAGDVTSMLVAVFGVDAEGATKCFGIAVLEVGK